MTSSFKKSLGTNSKATMNSVNGEVKTESEDPYALMNEFRSLYSEKLKAIEENCEDPTQAKIKTLEDWVNDLTEQNLALIETVEELEREALNRVNAINSLAMEARESVQQDANSKEAEKQMNKQLQDKISSLQEVINRNDSNLEACMKEIDELSKKLASKSEQYDVLRDQFERLQGLQDEVQTMQQLKIKTEPQDAMHIPQGSGTRSGDLKNKLNQLQNEVKEKEELLEKIRKDSLHQDEQNKAVVQNLQKQLLDAKKEVEDKYELEDRFARTSQWSEDLKDQVTRLESDNQEKTELLERTRAESMKEVAQKDAAIKELQESKEKACSDLESTKKQYLREKKEKETIKEQYNRLRKEHICLKSFQGQPSEKIESFNLRIEELESELRKKDCEIAELNREIQNKSKRISMQASEIEELKCKLHKLSSNSSKTNDLLQISSCREESFKKEILKLKNDINCFQKKNEALEETIQNLEEQLEASVNYDDSVRHEFNEQVCSLLSTIEAKDKEIKQRIEQENQMLMQISRMEQNVKDRDRRITQMSEEINKMSFDLRNKRFELEKLQIENCQKNFQKSNNRACTHPYMKRFQNL